ncbi:CSL4 [Acanthosepion pharaonis]|uniref:CSL4 n=1 Tax=Acanthosepion pharaonis TaxID=158019 RepID=A0A812CKS3_ACAPH|nr:CSL4 [Sepia pharaonis]
MAKSVVCIPGQKLCRLSEENCNGNGTYVRNGYVYSSLAGYLCTQTVNDKVLVEVRSAKDQNIVPSVGAIVTAKITNVNPRFCKCLIQNVGQTQLREPFRGMIRKEDVRATEKDKVEMYNCFRPGDIIVAKVLSLGDAHSYILTTAENELGVVLATSDAGYTMVPISWCEMQCPHSLMKEQRKVAKVQQQYIEYADNKT